jgi:methenyltetrahydromethanopterin cyclohydrolase
METTVSHATSEAEVRDTFGYIPLVPGDTFIKSTIANLSLSDQYLFQRFGQGPITRVPYRCIHHAFEAHARINPNAIAACHLDKVITYKELDYQDSADATVLVIENDKIPPIEIVEKIATACGISAKKLTIIVTPTSSIAGGVQVVGRVLEVAMHKAHELHFPLENIVDGSGSAPICPPHPDFVKAMGRTNDAILFAGQVHLFVKGDDAAAEKLAKELPSSTSKDYGKPFAEIFKAYEYDFFKVDGMLFSPASVIVTAVESGKSFRAGKLDNTLLNQSFGA